MRRTFRVATTDEIQRAFALAGYEADLFHAVYVRTFLMLGLLYARF